MYEIAHLIQKHRKEMEELESEQKREQRLRERKLKEIERLLSEAIRLNSETSEQELNTVAA